MIPIITLSLATLIILLVTFNIIKERFYPVCLYITALLLILPVTLTSLQFFVGTDIHLEYYLEQLSERAGWSSNLAFPGNSALGNTIVAPFLSKYLDLDVFWTFKILYPCLFATVPILIYPIFKRLLLPKEAFLACFFIMSMPAFLIEVPGIMRQCLGEFLLALGMLILLIPNGIRLRYRLPISTLILIASGVVQYSLGPVIILFLGAGAFVKLVLRIREGLPQWALPLITILVAIPLLLYYATVSSGTPLRYMTAVIPIEAQMGPIKIGPVTPDERVEEEYAQGPPIEFDITTTPPTYMETHETLVKSAIGMDFMKVTPLGKVFRILQFLTQLLVVIGFFLFWKSKKLFYTFGTVGALILVLCVAVPGFSAILNASRFYHLALLFLAPAFIAGGKLVFRRVEILVCIVLIPYFLFNAGVPFEATKQEMSRNTDIPYYIPLSSQRVDLTGNFTEDDLEMRKWIVTQSYPQVYGDFFGLLFLQESLGLDKRLRSLQTQPITSIPSGSWVYLRSTGEVVFWEGSGLRSYHTPEEVHLTEYTEVIKEFGNAKLLEVK